MEVLEKQFYLYFKAIYAAWGKKIPAEEAIPLFVEALRLTVKGFSLESESYRRFYTVEELMILNNIALEEYTVNEWKQRAIRRMYFLKKYFEKDDEKDDMDNEEWEKQYPIILSNLSNWEEDEGHYDKELNLAEEGLSICLKYNKLQCFDHLLFNKGIALAYLGKAEEAKKTILTALSIMRAKGLSEMADHCHGQVKKIFGFDFSAELQKML